MVLIGIDAHKRTHTAVAVDDVGRELAHTTVKATAAGHVALRRWASRWSERRFAVEDCRASPAAAGAPARPNLLAVSGCGLLSAGKLLGETGRASRFRSIDAYARFNGSAPVPVRSGNSEKMRLNRGGNRQVNTALHMIAVTQLRRGGPGADYVAKRQAAGDKTEALRLLRRRVSDAVFKAMLADKRQCDHRDHSDPSGDRSRRGRMTLT